MIALWVIGWANTALAEKDCQHFTSDRKPFQVCFDPGNHLSFHVASQFSEQPEPLLLLGMTGSLRHILKPKNTDAVWRLQHQTGLVGSANIWQGTLYHGEFLRYSPDGHVTLPTSPPRRIWLPFNVGASITALDMTTEDGITRAAPIDMSLHSEWLRRPDFLVRLWFGPRGYWHTLSPQNELVIEEHRVAPMSVAAGAFSFEQKNGLTILNVEGAVGRDWSSSVGWQSVTEAKIHVERVVVAFNDYPLAIYADAKTSLDQGWRAVLGIRFTPLSKSR